MAKAAPATKEISVKQAADLVGVNRRSIVYAIQHGAIAARKEAGFLYLCDRASVLQYKKDREKALAAQNGHAKPAAKPKKPLKPRTLTTKLRQAAKRRRR